MDLPSNDPDSLAFFVLEQYTSLKFQLPPHQYTILSGFVLTCSYSGKSKVISLGTGSKCMPATRLSPHGDSVNDSHAEVLARRGSIRWFFEEVQRVRGSIHKSYWIEENDDSKYKLRDSVRLHMYISTVPCGDASTRYLASYQDEKTALLKDSVTFPDQPPDKPWRGRDNYRRYGVLRTKPGRADSPPTVSMSCSDKVASWSVLGLQGALGSQIFAPLYISSIIIGEVEANVQAIVAEDCERALWQRIGDLEGLPNGYCVNRPSIRFSSSPFIHSQTSISHLTSLSGSCNDSLCWIADSMSKPEILINGLKRGVSPKNKHNPKYRPSLSKLSLYNVFHRTFLALQPPLKLPNAYFLCKQAARDYQVAKGMLLGDGPFKAWMRNGAKYQSFDLEGNLPLDWIVVHPGV